MMNTVKDKGVKDILQHIAMISHLLWRIYSQST